MEKLDLKKLHKDIYAPSAKKVNWLDLGPMQYLMIDGIGAPGSELFQQAVQALFVVSYTMKFQIKKGPRARDYGVMPLEGLWWADDMTHFTSDLDKSKWKWTMMIRQPDFITDADIATALKTAAAKKNPPILDGLRFDTFTEGEICQILHVGPFNTEGPTVEHLHAEIKAAGKSLRGKHHEIYLSDIRRAAPEKWRTILRQPVR
ncbi:MAG: GyrI-like domain-containing protein [Rhodobacteraceae bacterium]|nr:GyrI-like domain-containing protein [Paracoccaceae bacterium]